MFFDYVLFEILGNFFVFVKLLIGCVSKFVVNKFVVIVLYFMKNKFFFKILYLYNFFNKVN